MREIKFRAWDTIEKVMLDWLLLMQTAVNRGDRPLLYWVMSNPRFEKLQFTGLRDKSGKDVYEGDIVKGWMSYEDEGVITKPEECVGEVRFGMLLGLMAFYVTNGMNLVEHPIEVIGNIHENPELLK